MKAFIFRPTRRRSDALEVSAFFTSTEAVDSAVRQITEAGISWLGHHDFDQITRQARFRDLPHRTIDRFS